MADSAQSLVEQGLTLYSQGRLDEALAKWQAALQSEPGVGRAQEYITYVQQNRLALEQTFAASVTSTAPSQSASAGVEQEFVRSDQALTRVVLGGAADRLAQPSRLSSTEGGLSTTAWHGNGVSGSGHSVDGSSSNGRGSQLGDEGRLVVESLNDVGEPLRRRSDLDLTPVKGVPLLEVLSEEEPPRRERRPTASTLEPFGAQEPDGEQEALTDLRASRLRTNVTAIPMSLLDPEPSLGAASDYELRADAITPNSMTPTSGVIDEVAHDASTRNGSPSGLNLAVSSHVSLSEAASSAAMLMAAHDAYSREAYQEAEQLCQSLISEHATEQAGELLERSQNKLMVQYRARFADLDRVPMIQVPMGEIRWHNLDHRAGFLLSQIDGTLSYGDLLDICGMSEFEAYKILSDLLEQGVIS